MQRFKTLFLLILAGLVLTACNSESSSTDSDASTDDARTQAPTPTVVPVNIVTPSAVEPSPLPTQAPTPTSEPTQAALKAWRHLQSPELGISFQFPLFAGEASYEYNQWPNDGDPAGTLVSWQTTRSDLGWTYDFAGCASQDMRVGRERWITDNYRWFSQDGAYYVESSGGFSYTVTPLAIITHSVGTQALVFDPNESFWGDFAPHPQKTDRAAILNFPAGYHPEIQSLTLYFYEPILPDDIQRTVASIVFENPIESTQLPTPSPTVELAWLEPNFAGLVYKTQAGLWRVEVKGSATLLIDQANGRLSPDGNWVAWAHTEENYADIWLADLRTGERRNLTQTPDRVEAEPEWWPARPDVLLCTSDIGPFHGFGAPTSVNLDGSGYQALEMAGPVALSPDGQIIAAGCCGPQGHLYRWGSEVEVFDPALYGVSPDKLYQPSWSTDGRYLAWEAGGDLTGEGRWQLGLIVFDLQAKTHQILHPYEPLGGAETAHYVAWSPTGDWLAFVSWNEKNRFANLWIVSPDGSQEFYLGAGLRPVWSLDGQWLAYTQQFNVENNGVWAAQAGTWEQQQVLPQGAEAVDWID